jgi:hypothetical protein
MLANQRKNKNIESVMNELHDRINRVLNTPAFEAYLEAKGIDLIDFQCTWKKLSKGEFKNLPKEYQDAITAGERELEGSGDLVIA